MRCQIYVRIHWAVLRRQVHRSHVLFMALGVAHQWCVTPHLTRAELTTLCTTTSIPLYLRSYHKEYFRPSLYFIALVPRTTEPRKHSLTAHLRFGMTGHYFDDVILYKTHCTHPKEQPGAKSAVFRQRLVPVALAVKGLAAHKCAPSLKSALACLPLPACLVGAEPHPSKSFPKTLSPLVQVSSSRSHSQEPIVRSSRRTQPPLRSCRDSAADGRHQSLCRRHVKKSSPSHGPTE